MTFVAFRPLRAIDRMSFEPSKPATVFSFALPLSVFVIIADDAPPHDIFDIDMKELMQAANKIMKKMIQHVEKQIFLKRIQLGSMMKGRSSSYVRLVVIKLLLGEIKLH